MAGLGHTAGPTLRAASRRSILPGEGVLDLPGLSAPAEAHLDKYGIPHVRARSDADAYRVQGYLHARDRFFQMDLLRRVLRGGLAEIVGQRKLGALALPPFGKDATTVDADHLMRVLDLYPSAQRVWAAASPEGRVLLTAYVEGVNTAVRMMRRRRPLEHRLLRIPLAPWTPVDSLLVSKGMALGLSFKWRAAPVYTAVAEALEGHPEHLAQILPPVPGEGAFAMARCIAAGIGEALQFLPLDAPQMGSNAWVVGGGRTRSGKPLLSSDPHLELSLPSIWHLCSLRGSRIEAVGASLPGLPGVVVGRTPGLAWGVTNGMLDDADLWIEELDEHERHYRLDEAWHPLAAETQAIERRGRGPHLIRLRRTHRGPLLSDAFPNYAGPAISMRMTLQEVSQDMESFLGLSRARTVGAGLTAVKGYGSPAQNLLLADTEGRAAYRLIGLVPLRSEEVHPVFPRDGTTRATDWTGFVPDHEMPEFDVDPDAHLVSCNQPIVDGSYPHYLSHLYEPDYRALRVRECLRGRANLTTADMQAVMADAHNVAAKRFRKAVLEPHGEAARRLRPTLGPLLDRLLAWDGDEHVDARGAVPWHLVYHHLALRTFSPLLGDELALHWIGLMNLVDPALFNVFESEESLWAPQRVRATLLCEAMEDTARDLQRRGLTLDSPWGDFHQLTLKHPAGGTPALARTFNRGPYPIDGGPYSVLSGQYLHRHPGPMVVGQSYRQVVDLGEIQSGRMITIGGQSGHVGSPHYDDLTPLWLEGRTVPMHLETLPADAKVLHLRPA